jgi:hypothetical protein
MAIDFEMTPRQRKLKDDAREFAREVLRPVTERADAIADPQEAFVAMKPAFEAANALGFATSFLPAEYGGGGASIVDTIIVTEELAAVDGGFPTILLVNGLALMPLTWFGTEQQCQKWIGRAVDGTNTDFLGGWVVSERGGTANFDHPNPMAGIQLIAEPDKCWKAGHYLDLHERDGHALMADPGFTPDLFVDCEPFDFKKSMEGFGVGVEIR